MSAPDPIIAAIEGHRLASAAYDEAVDRWSAHEHDPIADEENYTAFSHLEKSWRALVSAEFKTLGGLVALLEYRHRACKRKTRRRCCSRTWSTIKNGRPSSDCSARTLRVASPRSWPRNRRSLRNLWTGSRMTSSRRPATSSMTTMSSGSWPALRSRPTPNIERGGGHERDRQIPRRRASASEQFRRRGRMAAAISICPPSP